MKQHHMFVRAYTSSRVHDVAGRGPFSLKPGRPVVQGEHNALQLNEGAPTQRKLERRAASMRRHGGRHPIINSTSYREAPGII